MTCKRCLELEAQVGMLRKAMVEIDTLTGGKDDDPEYCWLLDSEAVNRLYDLVDEAIIQTVRAGKTLERALEQTTQVGERWKAISRVVEAARKVGEAYEKTKQYNFNMPAYHALSDAQEELYEALAALERGGDK